MKLHAQAVSSLLSSGKALLCSTVGCGGSFPNMQKLMEHMRHHHKPNIFFLWVCLNFSPRLRKCKTVTWLLFPKVWELSHKVTILPRPPDSPAHLFQSATGQNKGNWSHDPPAYWNQPKHDPHGHGPEPPTSGFTPGSTLSNPELRWFLSCQCSSRLSCPPPPRSPLHV